MIAEYASQFLPYQNFILPRVYGSDPLTVRIEFNLLEKVSTQIQNCPRLVVLCEEQKLAEDADIDALLFLETPCGGLQQLDWNTANKIINGGFIQSIFFEVPVSTLESVNIFSFYLGLNPAEAELTARGRIYYDV